ncbi:LOW QUALITY PROTEIN: FAS-associated factor 1 [Rhagoletis pomonella]|uniref:LOW QUALITY PROTEIN: FAS-associated factor 1 n=1 Tax=Rhagoletis pomonella TaxID=28610 RepID=UPI0017869D0D|nr:LOW QUALITY PROTEIN: FAS-associated factor 1 [Rhagoletis pomonella]
MSENKDEILATFQSITGIDDVGEAFSHLEETNWDLMVAIQRVIPQDDVPSHGLNQTSAVRENTSGFSNTTALNDLSTNAGSSNCRQWSVNSASNQGLEASTSADAEIIDLTSDMDLDPARHNDVKTLVLNIHYNESVYTIRLPSIATIEQLKLKISEETNVPICRQAIRGWPPAKLQDARKITTQLCNLDLGPENDLILHNLSEEGYVDTENEEIAHRLRDTFNLTIVEQPSGKTITLPFLGSSTILEVKTKVYYVSNINVRNQEWEGWPSNCDDNLTLAQSGIGLSHNFTLRNASDKSMDIVGNSNNINASNNTIETDDDNSLDDEDGYDPLQDEQPVPPRSRHLIPNNIGNECAGSIEFFDNYRERFGEPHPVFYVGSLEDAIREACHKPARERKLLAIYLHHGDSILTNVFCDQVMKNERIIEAFAQNFILYGWDLTFETNKNMFLSSVTACVSNTASITISTKPVDKLPSLLIIGKSRLSGRSSCEVISIVDGNSDLNSFLSRLMDAVEMYKLQLKDEIREEDERAERDQVKAEQDLAYRETLEADMAKDAAKRQKEAAIAAERKRLESEKAEEDAKRESIRLVAQQSLPQEPSESETNVSTIRIQKPSGEFLERRFYKYNTLQDILNFVAANNYLIEENKLILISSWPRSDLTAIDPNKTLEELKLFPQAKAVLEER